MLGRESGRASDVASNDGKIRLSASPSRQGGSGCGKREQRAGCHGIHGTDLLKHCPLMYNCLHQQSRMPSSCLRYGSLQS